jgi:putative nucleotidyltransferase with HDIG domain
MSIEIEKDHEGQSFVPVPVFKVKADTKLCADVFLKINDKYLKFLNNGDSFEASKQSYFLEKNVNSLYILLENLEPFMQWLDDCKAEVINEIVEELGEECRPLVEKSEDIKEKIYETFLDEELDSEKVAVLKNQVEDFVDSLQSNSLAAKVLTQMKSHNESVADHCTNTANFAVYMAMLLGHGNSAVLEEIYLGALFHDYGKAKIPQAVLDNRDNVKYAQEIQGHPLKGATALKALEGIPKNVLKIVAQHHEHFNGNGYPKGLKGDATYGPAKIVQMANIFDNIIVENDKKSEKEKFRTAIKVLKYGRGKQFEPELVEKIVAGLELAYGHYKS